MPKNNHPIDTTGIAAIGRGAVGDFSGRQHRLERGRHRAVPQAGDALCGRRQARRSPTGLFSFRAACAPGAGGILRGMPAGAGGRLRGVPAQDPRGHRRPRPRRVLPVRLLVGSGDQLVFRRDARQFLHADVSLSVPAGDDRLFRAAAGAPLAACGRARSQHHATVPRRVRTRRQAVSCCRSRPSSAIRRRSTRCWSGMVRRRCPSCDRARC